MPLALPSGGSPQPVQILPAMMPSMIASTSAVKLGGDLVLKVVEGRQAHAAVFQRADVQPATGELAIGHWLQSP